MTGFGREISLWAYVLSFLFSLHNLEMKIGIHEEAFDDVPGDHPVSSHNCWVDGGRN